jgi:hypothetical protein
MRTLLALILSVLLPARGQRRTETVPTAPGRSVPRRLPAHRSPRSADVIEADHLPLVRPYVIAHERQREQWQQRERRRAAVMATLGQDYAPAVNA